MCVSTTSERVRKRHGGERASEVLLTIVSTGGSSERE
jgi:hypothetical protein